MFYVSLSIDNLFVMETKNLFISHLKLILAALTVRTAYTMQKLESRITTCSIVPALTMSKITMNYELSHNYMNKSNYTMKVGGLLKH